MRILILATLGAALVAGPAAAQTAEQDVKCMLAANVFSKEEKDPPRRQLAEATGIFFFGRMDARIAPAQLKPMIIAQGKTLTAVNLGQVMTDCAKRLQARQMALQAIGKAVAATQPTPAPAPAPAPKPR